MEANKKYWYLFTIYECPVCGSQDVIRERRYTPKPKNYHERHLFNIRYDWCNEIVTEWFST